MLMISNCITWVANEISHRAQEVPFKTIVIMIYNDRYRTYYLFPDGTIASISNTFSNDFVEL